MASVDVLEAAETLFPRDEGYVALTVCICANTNNLQRAAQGQIAYCRDMPWQCQREVLPACNTGVHRPANDEVRKEVCPLFERPSE